jgi:chlorobactene glucosyltransferase
MAYVASTDIFMLIGGLFGLFWLIFLSQLIRSKDNIPNLSENSTRAQTGARPRISVIVAAKDEAVNIEACVRSILRQNYSDFELIVVNDRSADDTAKILRRMQNEQPGRLKVVHVQQVPAGWGGQNHAIYQGVNHSTGEWLCFTDADCRFESDRTLVIAWQEAQTRGLAMLTLLPRLVVQVAWEKIYLPIASLILLSRLHIGAVNTREKSEAYANGAFILFRRDAYLALGGHAAVRGRLNDDIALAQLAKQQGYPIRVVGNENLLSARMYGDVRSAWYGWVRNFSGALQPRRSLAIACGHAIGLFVIPWMGFGAALACVMGCGPQWLAAAGVWGVSVVLSHLGLWRVYRSFELSPMWSLVYFPGAVVVVAMLTAANLRAWRQAGTVWHGIRYTAAPATEPTLPADKTESPRHIE